MKLLEREAVPPAAAEAPAENKPRRAAWAGLRGVPRAAWACAAIAFANAAIWAAITPSFQVPDEWDHAGYVQYVAEKGDLPTPAGARSPEYARDLAAAATGMPFTVEGDPTWSPFVSRRYHRNVERASRSPGGTGSASVNNPPLYYVYDAIPYRIARAAEYPTRLYVMRLGSALLGALAVLFTFLFIREVLPGTRWAWPLGALAVAFQPVFGFMSGGVNNDVMMYAAGSALLFLFARAFRRGLTPGLGFAIGLTMLAGLLSKSSFLGLVPGALLGCALLVWRASDRRREALLGVGAAVVTAAIPFGAWMIVNEQVFDRVATTTGGFTSHSINQATSVAGQLSYLWQWFLPRLPFMSHFDTADYPLWDTYFQAFVGRFGWFQYGFPMWVNWVGLGIAVGLCVLAVAAIRRAHLVRTSRWPELLTYAALLAGLVLLVNVAGYRYLSDHAITFEQVRYLFPMIGLWGLFVAVAARGVGRRWGPVVAGFLVVVLMAHSLFAMLLTLARYYA